MDLVLIACCQSKTTGGESNYLHSKALASQLSDSSVERLISARKELAEMRQLTPGFDLGFNNHDPNLRYLLAYQRYIGNVYSSSQIASLFPNTGSLRVLIISALYGLLDAYDLIRDYDLAMNDTLPIKSRLKTWWKRKGLGVIVEEYIQEINPSEVHDFLSGHYRDALRPWPPEALSHKMWTYSYPGQGIGSNWSRGKDLKSILESHRFT